VSNRTQTGLYNFLSPFSEVSGVSDIARWLMFFFFWNDASNVPTDARSKHPTFFLKLNYFTQKSLKSRSSQKRLTYLRLLSSGGCNQEWDENLKLALRLSPIGCSLNFLSVTQLSLWAQCRFYFPPQISDLKRAIICLHLSLSRVLFSLPFLLDPFHSPL